MNHPRLNCGRGWDGIKTTYKFNRLTDPLAHMPSKKRPLPNGDAGELRVKGYQGSNQKSMPRIQRI